MDLGSIPVSVNLVLNLEESKTAQNCYVWSVQLARCSTDSYSHQVNDTRFSQPLPYKKGSQHTGRYQQCCFSICRFWRAVLDTWQKSCGGSSRDRGRRHELRELPNFPLWNVEWMQGWSGYGNCARRGCHRKDTVVGRDTVFGVRCGNF